MHCERISAFNWNNRVSAPQTCYMDTVTRIEVPESFALLSRDESIQGLNFHLNQKIYYLPIHVHENLPNLIVYNAEGCSITTIVKANFEKLISLRVLSLNDNNIELISSDTFQDLNSIEWIILRKINTLSSNFNLLIRISHQTTTKFSIWTGNCLLTLTSWAMCGWRGTNASTRTLITNIELHFCQKLSAKNVASARITNELR